MIKKKLAKKPRTSQKPETVATVYKTDFRSFTPTRVVKQPVSAMAEYSNNIINTSCKSFKKKKNIVKVLISATPQKERPEDPAKNIFKHIETKNVPLSNKLDPAFKSKRLEKVYRLTPSGSPLSGRSLALSCRDSLKTSNTESKTVKVEQVTFSVKSQTERMSLEYLFEGHTNSVNSLDLNFGYVLSASQDYSIKKWKLLPTVPGPYMGKEYTQGQVFENSASLIRYSRPALFVAGCKSGVLAGFTDRSLRFLTRENEKVLNKKSEFLMKTCKKTAENFLMVGDGIEKFDTEKWELFRCFPQKNLNVLQVINENFVVSGDLKGQLMLFDFRARQVVQTWKAHHDLVSGVDYCEKGIFSCSEDGKLKLWDIRSFSLVEENRTDGRLKKVVFFKDKVFTGGDSLRVWNNGLVACLSGRCKDFICRDGLLVATRDHQVVVWNIQTTNTTNEYI